MEPFLFKHIGLGILVPFILLGNGGLITVISINKDLYTSTNFFIIGLASADFLVGAILPFYICAERLLFPGDPQLVCLIVMSHIATQVVASVMMLLAVSIERYIFIVHPFKWSTWITKRRVRIGIVCSWIYSFLYGYSPVMGWNSSSCPVTNTSFPQNQTHPCNFFVTMSGSFVAVLYYGHIVCAWVLMLPLHSHVIYVSMKTAKRISVTNVSSEKPQGNLCCEPCVRNTFVKASGVWIIITMVLYFIFSWLLMVIWYTIIYRGFQCQVINENGDYGFPIIFYEFAIFFSIANSAINPLIYGFGNRTIRRKLLKHLQKIKGKFCPKMCIKKPNKITALSGVDTDKNLTTMGTESGKNNDAFEDSTKDQPLQGKNDNISTSESSQNV